MSDGLISNQNPLRPRLPGSPPPGIHTPGTAPEGTIPEPAQEEDDPEKREFLGAPLNPELQERLKGILHNRDELLRQILGGDPPRKVNVGSFPWR